MSCVEVRSLLPSRPLEVLEEDEAALVEKHLSECPACKKRAVALEAAWEHLREERALPRRRENAWVALSKRLDEPAPPAEPEPGPVVSIALVCCFCRDAIARAEATYCASCLAPHHGECFRAHGRCSAFGCEETRTVRPEVEGTGLATPPAPTRRSLRLVGLLAFGGVAIGAAALTTERVMQARHQRELAEVRSDAAKDYEIRLKEAIERLRHDLERQKPVGPLNLSAEELEKRIAAFFADIERLAKEEKIDELIQRFVELERLLEEYRRIETEEAKKKLAAWEKRLEEFTEIRLAVQLQVSIGEANRLFQEIQRAAAAGDAAKVASLLAEVEALAAKMRRQPRPEFAANAQVIVTKANELAKLATTPARARPARRPRPSSPQPDAKPGTSSLRGEGKGFTVDLEDMDLAQVMAEISRKSGQNVIVAGRVRERVTLSLVDVPLRDAVDVMAKMTRCEVLQLWNGTLLLDQPPLVTVQAEGGDVRDALAKLAADAGVTIVVAADVHGKLSLDLTKVHWLVALENIVKACGLVASRKDNVVVVAKGKVVFGAPAALSMDVQQVWGSRALPSNAKKVTLDVKNAELDEVCDQIGRQVGLNILVEPSTRRAVTLAVKNAVWTDVIEALVLGNGLVLEQRGSGFVLSERPRVTIDAAGVPAAAWFTLLAKQAGLQIVVAPEVTGTIGDVMGTDASYRDLLEATAIAHGFGVAIDGEVLRIVADRTHAGDARRKAPIPPARAQTIELAGKKLTFALQAIVHDERPDGASRAIIDGRSYGDGDVIRDGLRVAAIKDTVEVSSADGSRVKLTLP